MSAARETPHDPLAAAVIRALASDPEALSRLRQLIDFDEGHRHDSQPLPPAYTVASLAAAVGVSAKAIRNAITRGELAAVKRAGRWLIAADAVDAWTQSPQPRRIRPGSRRKGDGPLGQAFQRIDLRARSA